MKIIDPLPVKCHNCAAIHPHPTDELLRLVAVCPNCHASLETIGQRMRAQIDDASHLWISVEMHMAIEESTGIELPVDTEFQTLRHICNLLLQASNGETDATPKALDLKHEATRIRVVKRAALDAANRMSKPIISLDEALDLPLLDVIRVSSWNSPSTRNDHVGQTT